MKTILSLTLSGSALALLLLLMKALFGKKLSTTAYYYAWLVVLLRFLLPLPGLIPTGQVANGAGEPVKGAVIVSHRPEAPGEARTEGGDYRPPGGSCGDSDTLYELNRVREEFE